MSVQEQIGSEGFSAAGKIAPTILEARKITKRFGGFVAVNGVELSVRRGERIGLIGPNGSGKSTLTNCLCGTLRIDDGAIEFEGESIALLPAHKRARRGVARSFQLPKPFHSLSLIENMRVPLEFTVCSRKGTHMSKAEMRDRSFDLLEVFGLASKAQRLPGDLTQVEMRKLELARAMATDPKLLFSDEAMAGLSHSEVDEILELLLKLNSTGVSIIFIEHIIRAVMTFSERLVVLVAGQKIADGDPKSVIENQHVIEAYLGQ
ncbi:branched-chain amino acid transport system ATP-binding protein [Neorhizobium galegae]|uniref:ABC transporter ATP-binding protein n=1 Tax=Neorhizobium galegae TaxID=399 RepID=UPI0027820D6C|nr:ABC transporter ATP-binding protein [Neorhizobium galegae]MDQ0137630.1 branched-chain amino acid transport system ATP-binding protein [Neorhizobium galegae]